MLKFENFSSKPTLFCCAVYILQLLFADNQIRLGNKLLVYISCCLAGRAYPLGEIPSEHVARVKEEVRYYILLLLDVHEIGEK